MEGELLAGQYMRGIQSEMNNPATPYRCYPQVLVTSQIARKDGRVTMFPDDMLECQPVASQCLDANPQEFKRYKHSSKRGDNIIRLQCFQIHRQHDSG